MIRTIGVIGAGQMGNGIAHVAALHGYDVKLVDVDVYQIDKAKETIDQNIGRQVKRGPTEEVSGLTKVQAETLLDWLEAWGCSALEGSLEDDGFTVRWTWSPARSLSAEQVRKMISEMTGK